jgi:hypothetical protein
MAITERKGTLFIASDGQVFADHDKAAEYELDLELTAWNTGVCLGKGGTWDEEMILRAIKTNGRSLYNILHAAFGPRCV